MRMLMEELSATRILLIWLQTTFIHWNFRNFTNEDQKGLWTKVRVTLLECFRYSVHISKSLTFDMKLTNTQQKFGAAYRGKDYLSILLRYLFCFEEHLYHISTSYSSYFLSQTVEKFYTNTNMFIYT